MVQDPLAAREVPPDVMGEDLERRGGKEEAKECNGETEEEWIGICRLSFSRRCNGKLGKVWPPTGQATSNGGL